MTPQHEYKRKIHAHESSEPREKRLANQCKYQKKKIANESYIMWGSEVTTFEGLIYITDLCENKIAVLQDVAKEMDCLRTSVKLSLCVSQLYDLTGSIFKLCYRNTRSVHRHIEDLRKDLLFMC